MLQRWIGAADARDLVSELMELMNAEEIVALLRSNEKLKEELQRLTIELEVWLFGVRECLVCGRAERPAKVCGQVATQSCEVSVGRQG